MEDVKSRIVKNVLEATLEPMTKLIFFWADHYNTCLDPLAFLKTQLYGFQNEGTNSRPSTSHEEAEKHECLQPFPLILSSKRTHLLCALATSKVPRQLEQNRFKLCINVFCMVDLEVVGTSIVRWALPLSLCGRVRMSNLRFISTILGYALYS